MNEVMTHDVIEALRQGDSKLLSQFSPCAASLLPLISVLEHKISISEIAEVLPHYSFVFDLDALRSILARLGYISERYSNNLETVDAENTPFLYVDSHKQVYVIYQRKEDEYVYFNSSTGKTQIGKLDGAGEIYFLTFQNRDGEASRVHSSWFGGVLYRFRGIAKHLVGISLVLNLTSLAVPLFIMVVYDFVIGKQNLAALPMLAIAITFILLIDLSLRLIRARILAIPAGRLEYLLSTESLNQLLNLPAAMTERSSVPVQLSKLRLYDSVREFLTGPTAILMMELPFTPIFIGVLAWLGGDIVLVPILVILFFIIAGACIFPFSKKRIALAAESRTERERLLLETLSGALEIRAMGEVEAWLRRMAEASTKTMHVALSASQSQIVVSTLTQAVVMLAAVAIVALGGHKAIANDISIGALIASMAIFWRIVGPLQGAFLAYGQMNQIRQGIRGLDELMSLKPERRASRSSLLQGEFRGDVTFERVGFRYAQNLDPVLKGVDFRIPANSLAVIVGGNGSGKSTVLKLLCGLYHAQMGNILIDNTDIRQLNVNELRRIVGYVPQHPRLFFGDISHNLRLGNILATDEELRQAADAAGILKDIEDMPKGFETRIGDNASSTLPSGFQRGLCIARALLYQSPVLILDEPGGTKDKYSLYNFTQQLSRIKGTKTIVVVSHAPQLIRLADRVIVMDQGLNRAPMTPDEYLSQVSKAVAS